MKRKPCGIFCQLTALANLHAKVRHFKNFCSHRSIFLYDYPTRVQVNLFVFFHPCKEVIKLIVFIRWRNHLIKQTHPVITAPISFPQIHTIIEFSLNYTKLAIKEEQNKFKKKKLCPVGMEPRTPLVAPLVLHSHASLTELTWHCLSYWNF